MSQGRLLIVIVLLFGVGIAQVMLRHERARCWRRMQSLHQEISATQRSLWAQELELAGLRSPVRLRQSAEEMKLNVTPPQVKPGKRQAVRGGD